MTTVCDLVTQALLKLELINRKLDYYFLAIHRTIAIEFTFIMMFVRPELFVEEFIIDFNWLYCCYN